MRDYVVSTARQLVDIHGQEIIQFEEAYAKYLEQFGYQLIVLPISLDVQTLCNLNPQMILLPGGGDVPIEYYDSKVETFSQERRNLIEIQLIKYALDNRIPLLGICRGMQMINGFFGGKVTRMKKRDCSVTNHNVYISDCNNVFEVNSFHRDIIKMNGLAAQFTPIAFHKCYHHVEAFISTEYPILGLQWHPERANESSICRQYSNILIRQLMVGRSIL